MDDKFTDYKKTLENIDKECLIDYLYYSFDGIFVVDANGKLILTNPAVIEMLGSSYDELIGHYVNEIVESGIYEGSTTLESIRIKDVYTGLVKTRSDTEIMSTSRPVFDEDGKLQFVITNCRPISVIKTFYSNYFPESEISAINKNATSTNLIYSSKAMNDIIQKITYASQTNCSIMLLGQTGTGKGVMAKYIHEHSNRSKHQFIEINCAAIPENLLESELFGYEKGAFTGANTIGKMGLFEIANKGTIFLDEIAELPLHMQAKLLKVLDSGYILRVGGTVSRKVNVRIVSATNRNLKDMIRQGKFREDLFYRLNVLVVRIPDLKDRKEEIEPISNYILSETNIKYNLNKIFSPDALRRLELYDWPGNIRQLRNFIEKSIILSGNDDLINESFIDSLLEDEEDINSDENECGIKNTSAGLCNESLKDYMARTEQEYINKCIKESNGSVSVAAEKLGVHRTGLYKKLGNKKPTDDDNDIENS